MEFTAPWLFQILKAGPLTAGLGRHRQRFVPRVEGLELRDVPSTITVVNPLDSGPGSLRDALATADNGDTINFSDRLAGQTIRLTSGELALTKSVDVVGLGADRLTVSGEDAGRVFHVAAGVTVTLSGLTVARGQAPEGGGIDNAGDLSIRDSVLADNRAAGGPGGGAVLNREGATLALEHDLLTGNRAVAAVMADVFGGGLLNKGTATVTASTFRGNQALGGASASFFGGSVGGAIDNFGGRRGGAQLTVADSVFIANQAVSAAGPYAGIGGAIENNAGPNEHHGSTAVITGSTFSANLATGGQGSNGNGGALVNEGAGATMTVSNSVLVANRSAGGPGGDGETTLSQGIGGAILNGFAGATLTVSDCTLVGNRAIGGDHAVITADNPLTGGGAGGGVVNAAGATATVIHSTLVANEALGGATDAGPGGNGLGGGIENSYALPPSHPSTLTVMDSVLIGNRAVAGRGGPGSSDVPAGLGVGGAIDDSFFSIAQVLDCTLIDNAAVGGTGANGGAGLGGGIAVGTNAVLSFTDQSSVEISGSTLEGNRALGGSGGQDGTGGDGLGGGLAIFAGSAAAVSASTIEGNAALGGQGASPGSGIGGGVYNLGTFTFDDLTVIRRNRASTSNNDVYP